MSRSLLYVPAHEQRFIERAHERNADAIILDLEDSVPESCKDAARTALTESIAAVRRSGATVYVRLNATDARLLEDASAAKGAGADGLFVPKVHSAQMLLPLVTLTDALVPIIEDASGLCDAREIARVPNVIALCLGAEDFAASLGAVPSADVIRVPKLLVHYAAKAEGRLSFGMLRSVVHYKDTEALKQAAEEAAMHGFDGATCIHPSAVSVLNSAFTPSAAMIEWATRVIEQSESAEQQGLGAFLLDGEFVDAAVVSRADAVLKCCRS